jgi:general secretion pathway protein E
MLKILFPTDYSDCSSEALRYALTLAGESGGSLLILHVVEPMSPYLVPETGEPTANSHRDDFFAQLKGLLSERTPVPYEERTIIGAPVASIVHVAESEHVDLIVMGTTGRTGVKRLLLGSVAEEVVRRAPCPVLTLKAPSEEAIERRARATAIRHWPAEAIEAPETALPHLPEESPDNPALSLIMRGIRARASDIHIDPIGENLLVRFRVDGRMKDYCRMDRPIGHSVATQLKLMANMDIADPFHPKEGRLNLPDSLLGIDVRITAVPVAVGEAISLRLLSRDRLVRSLHDLGLSDDALKLAERMLGHGEGIILVTGPTGSGKTTTMYSMLRALDDGTRNIVSIEDPIEFVIPSFRQLAVDFKHDITMTSGLKTLLRLDPDVVFVSEIRDGEAAEAAMRAASSGKYVFSSLHTRDVASTITALRDLHIDSRSLGGNLTGIVSQRLVRRLCRECCRTAAPTDAEAAVFATHSLPIPNEIGAPVGCPRCLNSGYFDRIGVFEVVIPDPEIIRAIDAGCTEDELRSIIRSHGTCSLEADVLDKVARGITSLAEYSSMTTIKFGV